MFRKQESVDRCEECGEQVRLDRNGDFHHIGIKQGLVHTFDSVSIQFDSQEAIDDYFAQGCPDPEEMTGLCLESYSRCIESK